MQDGNRIDLSTSKCSTRSGLKTSTGIRELLAGIQYDLVLDFDAAQSIVKAGNSGQYILKPVLRVVAEGTASIRGKVSPIAASSTVFGIQNGDTLATFTDDRGDFILKGLNQGEYRVEIHPIEPYLGDTLLNVPTQLARLPSLSLLNWRKRNKKINLNSFSIFQPGKIFGLDFLLPQLGAGFWRTFIYS